MRFLILMGISLLVVLGSGSTTTSGDNRFAKPITVADNTPEESQSATHICYQVARSTPFPFDDFLCGVVNAAENFDDVVRAGDEIADYIAQTTRRILTGTMTSASNIRELLDSNVLSFNYAQAFEPSDEDSEENVLADADVEVEEDESNCPITVLMIISNPSILANFTPQQIECAFKHEYWLHENPTGVSDGRKFILNSVRSLVIRYSENTGNEGRGRHIWVNGSPVPYWVISWSTMTPSSKIWIAPDGSILSNNPIYYLPEQNLVQGIKHPNTPLGGFPALVMATIIASSS